MMINQRFLLGDGIKLEVAFYFVKDISSNSMVNINAIHLSCNSLRRPEPSDRHLIDIGNIAYESKKAIW